ncbi:hypothetical protein Vretimale_6781, partial [Volvox reticuliferus]
MNALLDDTVANPLVDLHADGALGNVPDDASLTLIPLVWHTLMDSTIDLDVDIIPKLVGPQVSGQRNVALLAEATGKHMPRAGTKTLAARHSSLLFCSRG